MRIRKKAIKRDTPSLCQLCGKQLPVTATSARRYCTVREDRACYNAQQRANKEKREAE